MQARTYYGPPGTGKTTTLLKLVEALTATYKPSEIAFLSFTRAAANEALKRMGVKRNDNVCTIHSLLFRKTGVSQQQVVNWAKIKAFSAAIGIPMTGGKATEGDDTIQEGDEYMSIYDYARATRVTPDRAYEDSDRPGTGAKFRYFHAGYENWKRENGFVDFTDMLTRYLDKPTPIGTKVVIIDEAQDLSPLQWVCIEHLLSSGVELAVIAGDDDQSIFQWGGADPHGMDKWTHAHKAEKIVLSQSYRVPESVFKVATDISSRITQRVQKEYRPRSAMGTVERVTRGNGVDRISAVADTLYLCRTTHLLKEIERDIIRRGLPYIKTGGMPGLLQNKWANGLRAKSRQDAGEPMDHDDLDAIDGLKTMPGWMSSYYDRVDLFAEPKLRLSTIHSAKGAEAYHVILNTGLTDRVARGMERDPDAEHRVFYVAVTRAEKHLDLIEGMDSYPI